MPLQIFKITNRWLKTSLRRYLHLGNSYNPEALEGIQPTLPVTDIRPSIQDNASESITATGTVEFFRVPQNQRWHLKHLDITEVNGDNKFSWIRINDAYPNLLYLWRDSETDNVIVPMYNDIVLEEGWKIEANISTNTVNGTMRMDIQYTLEETV
jgi:hypothetical protein